jgi:hypothetical protein
LENCTNIVAVIYGKNEITMYRRLWKSLIPVSSHIQSEVFEVFACKFSLNFWRSHPQSTNLSAGSGLNLFLHMYGAKLLGDCT